MDIGIISGACTQTTNATIGLKTEEPTTIVSAIMTIVTLTRHAMDVSTRPRSIQNEPLGAVAGVVEIEGGVISVLF